MQPPKCTVVFYITHLLSLFFLSLCSAVQTSPSSSGGVFSGGLGQLPGRPLGGGGGGILGNGK